MIEKRLIDMYYDAANSLRLVEAIENIVDDVVFEVLSIVGAEISSRDEDTNWQGKEVLTKDTIYGILAEVREAM